MDNTVMEVLRKVGRPFIVGSSAIEEVLGVNIHSSDVDVLMETDKSLDTIKERLEGLDDIFIFPNSFGNLKISHDGMVYDVWRVQDTTIYEKGFEMSFTSAEQVVQNFMYNLYQVAIRPDGEIYCTKAFIQYVKSGELTLVNENVLNYKRQTTKAIKNDILIRREIGGK